MQQMDRMGPVVVIGDKASRERDITASHAGIRNHHPWDDPDPAEWLAQAQPEQVRGGAGGMGFQDPP
jgi:hypothetical protein